MPWACEGKPLFVGLEPKPQSKLYLPRRERLRDRSERGVAHIAVGREEVGPVEKVEHLRTELQASVFRCKRKLLVQRKIKLGEIGGPHGIPSRIAKRLTRIGNLQ